MERLSQDQSLEPDVPKSKDTTVEADDTLMNEAHFQALLKTAETLQGMIARLASEGKRDLALEEQLKDQQQLIAYQRSLRPDESPEILH